MTRPAASLRLLGLAGLALVTACSASMDLAERGPSGADFDDIAEGTLRLDVVPPTSAGDGTLLAQSTIVLPGNYEGLPIELVPTRTVSGVLTADVARGWQLGPPTSPEPLVATLRTLPGDGRLGGTAQSDADGIVTLTFPAYSPGRFPVSIVPQDASMAPLRVVAAPTTDTDDWNQTLAVGIPVYGRVTGFEDGVESGLEGVQMRIARSAEGDTITSGVFTTDASGWYVARVDELGEYTLEVVGGSTTSSDHVAPNLAVSVLVESETGVEVPIALGEVGEATADGAVVDPDGRAVSTPRVRFTSVSLDGGVGALVVETEGTPDGNFISRELLAGEYDIEIMPPYAPEPTVSPLRVPRQRIDANTRFDTFRLAPATRLSGAVIAVSGEPAADLLVVATEAAYAGNVYYTRTTADGRFDLAVPNVPLDVTLTPARPAEGAVTRFTVDAPGADQGFVLDEGVLVDGVLTFADAPVAFGSVDVYDAASGVLLGQAIADDTGAFSLRVAIPTTGPDEDTADDTADDTGGDTAR